MGDITYLGTDEGWLYLAVVLDLYSRKVVGWSMSDRMTATLVCDALRMALFNRKRLRGVIVHSDRGSQYCSRDRQGATATFVMGGAAAVITLLGARLLPAGMSRS